MSIVNISKSSFNKDDYTKIINVNFTQLIPNPKPQEFSITVDEFFIAYDDLFFEIPIDGDFNSHKELIKRSTEYVGETQNTDEIDLLLDEINQLKLDLLEARQLIDDLTQ